MGKTPLPITPGGTVGADLSNSPTNGQPDRSDTPAGDTSKASKNINWLNGSYAGADIKVVAHLYGKVAKDSELSDGKDQAKLNRQIADGASALSSSTSRGSMVSSTDAQIRASFEEKCLAAGCDPQAIGILYQRLYVAYSQFVTSRSTPTRGLDFQASCEDTRLEYTTLAESIEDAIKSVTDNEDSSSTVTLENLQTLSVQTYREKTAVRSLGKSYVSGYVRGPRTIGGSMIFTMVQEHPLTRLIKAMDSAGLYGETQYDYKLSSLISDQLPPIDLTIVFANEYGSISKMGIYGVEFMTDGLTLSSEDMLTEVVCQFVARDIDVPTAIGMRKLMSGTDQVIGASGKPLDASSLAMGSRAEYNEFLDKVGLRSVFKGR